MLNALKVNKSDVESDNVSCQNRNQLKQIK